MLIFGALEQFFFVSFFHFLLLKQSLIGSDLQKVIEKGQPLSEEDMSVAKRYSVFVQRDKLFSEAAAKLAAKSQSVSPEVPKEIMASPPFSMNQTYALPRYMLSGPEMQPTGQNWSATMRYVHGHGRHLGSPGY
jgi:hypothetical protein